MLHVPGGLIIVLDYMLTIYTATNDLDMYLHVLISTYELTNVIDHEHRYTTTQLPCPA